MDILRTSTTQGMHPKMADKVVPFIKQAQRLGGDVGKHKRRRKSQRTYIDSNSNTIFLD